MGIAAIVIGNHIFRIEADRLVVILDGAVVIALAGVGAAAIVIGRRICRIESDRLVVLLDGAVVIALVEVNRPTI